MKNWKRFLKNYGQVERSRMAKTAQDFINAFSGKVDDFDGAYGAQCVDAFKRFCQWIGIPVYPTRTNWADGYWKYRIQYSAYVKFITNPKELKPGDWLFWAIGSSCPSSHVGMFVRYAEEDGYAYVFGQNQGGNGGYTIVKLRLDILGAFRFNALQEQEPQWVDGKAKMPDGTVLKNQFVIVDGKVYHTDANGCMQKRTFVTENGVKYFMLDHGVMAASRWVVFKGKWYFFGKNGAQFIGKHHVPVMFDKNGVFIGNQK
jgi:hypothetical protein